MKNFKFSRLFAAVAFVAVLALSGCKQQVEDTSRKIEGTWVSTDSEKYVITGTDYDNYYGDSLYYSTNNLSFNEIDSTSGFIYGQFDDENHVGYGASKGQWYALYYNNLTDSSVKWYQPYKSGGKAGCDSLEEAKQEYTIDNDYYDFSSPSVCTKQ